jgi:hypothetical protein
VERRKERPGEEGIEDRYCSETRGVKGGMSVIPMQQLMF